MQCAAMTRHPSTTTRSRGSELPWACAHPSSGKSELPMPMVCLDVAPWPIAGPIGGDKLPERRAEDRAVTAPARR